MNMHQDRALIREQDARLIIRLLGQVAGMDGGLAAKRRHLANGLAQLIHCQVWMWSAWTGGSNGENRIPLWFIDDGWSGPEQRAEAMIAFTADCGDDIIKRMNLRHAKHWTQLRQDFYPDSLWHASPFQQHYRDRAGLSDFLMSSCDLGDNAHCSLGMHRTVGTPAFTDRERTITHLVTSQMHDIFLTEHQTPLRTRAAGLSERRRQVLMLMLCGDGAKQIAEEMNLSEHTIREYIQFLYRHFEVSSRGELLALFIHGGPPQTR